MSPVMMVSILVSMLAGCDGLPPNTSPTAITPTPGASSTLPAPTSLPNPPATATRVPATATPTPEPAAENNRYQITASFDYNQHTLSVDEQVTFTNPGPEAYPGLAFQVEANNQAGVFTLKSVALADGQPTNGYSLAKNRLTIPLAEPLLPGQSSQASFSFDLALQPFPPPSDTAEPVVFGYTSRQTNLVDWFPYLPPYLPGQGWVIHNPGYFGEHTVYPIADFDVTLNLANPPANLKIAAPAPAQVVDNGYHYLLPNARTFAWSASPTYVVQTQSVGDVTILSYNFPLDDAAAKMALQNTADAVKLYSQLFGPYQHSTLSVVEADFLDGMEEDGLYFLSKGFYNLYDGTPKGYLTIIAAHETAHQWWFARVADDQALEPWLDEALATYTEEIFIENTYPDLVKWWWSFRVNFYTPVGVINQSIYDYDGYEHYRNAVYLRGALFLDGLRHQIGDDAFFAFLKDYAATEEYKIATANDFFTILAKHTNQDISKAKAGYFK